jgi:hypothetical protein
MSPFGSSGRASRIGILVLIVVMTLIALEVWGIRASIAQLR